MLADKIPLYSTYGLVGPHILKTTMQRNAFLTALNFLINLKQENKKKVAADIFSKKSEMAKTLNTT